MFTWTTDPPTDEGWYWAKDLREYYEKEKPYIVYLRWFDDQLCQMNWPIRTELMLWAGPISEPETPDVVSKKSLKEVLKKRL